MQFKASHVIISLSQVYLKKKKKKYLSQDPLIWPNQRGNEDFNSMDRLYE